MAAKERQLCTIEHFLGSRWPFSADTPLDMHDHAFHQALGTTLRERRAALALNQVDVAELAGCSTRFVHAAEAGKATLRLDKLVAVLDVLGLDLLVRLSAAGTGTTNRDEHGAADRPAGEPLP